MTLAAALLAVALLLLVLLVPSRLARASWTTRSPAWRSCSGRRSAWPADCSRSSSPSRSPWPRSPRRTCRPCRRCRRPCRCGPVRRSPSGGSCCCGCSPCCWRPSRSPCGPAATTGGWSTSSRPATRCSPARASSTTRYRWPTACPASCAPASCCPAGCWRCCTRTRSARSSRTRRRTSSSATTSWCCRSSRCARRSRGCARCRPRRRRSRCSSSCLPTTGPRGGTRGGCWPPRCTGWGTASSGGTLPPDVLVRAQRLVDQPARLPRRSRAAVLGGVVGVLALPPLGLLLPLLQV